MNELFIAIQFLPAYTFQWYYYQVIQGLHSKYGEHNGFDRSSLLQSKYPFHRCMRASYSIGVVTIILIFLFYSFIMVIQYYSLQIDDPDSQDKIVQKMMYAVI